MAQSAVKLEGTDTAERVYQTIHLFLKEMGNAQSVAIFEQRRWAAHLESDLSLGSLERVELMLRVDSALGIQLPESTLADALTAGAILGAVLAAQPAQSGASTSPNIPPPVHSGEFIAMPETVRTLTDALLYRARLQPEKTHILLYGDDPQARPITHGELLRGAQAVGAALQRRGLRPGGAVALMLPTCAEFFPCFFGILLAGGVPVPLYPPFRADRIEEYAARQTAILQNAEAHFLLTFHQAERVARLLQPSVPTLQGVVDAAELAREGREFLDRAADGRPQLFLPHQALPEELALVQYTSGSTGSPKGVMVTHANLLANIRSIGAAANLGPEDVAVSWLPLYHDMGLIGAWFVPLFFGIPVVVLSPLAFLKRPARWLQAIHRHRGTISPAPNFAYELAARKIPDEEIAGLDLSSWRAALNGAEPVRMETVERFVRRFAACGFQRGALIPVYGLAEATLGVCSPAFGSGTKVDRVNRQAFETRGRAIPAVAGDPVALPFVCVGRPMPGVEVRIMTTDQEPATERHEGKLLFRSPGATQGYYRNPEATRALIREDGWLDSGDLAYQADGEIYITGRAKDVIIKGGRNLSPHEIEEVAGRVAGVRTGCVVAFGAPDQRSGTDRLVIVAEIRPGAQKEQASAEIVRQVSDSLGLPPDVVDLLPAGAIPKTSSGKLRRNETRRLFLAGMLGVRPAPVWMQVAKLAARNALPALARGARKLGRRWGEIAYGVYALLVAAFCFGMLRVALLFTRSEEGAARVVQFFARTMVRGCFVSVELVNGGLLRDWNHSGPWIFAPNHSSYVDIILFTALLPRDAKFVAKSEVLSMPIISAIVRAAGHFAFNRGNAQARVAQAQAVDDALRRGRSVIIYPEGTFTAAPGIRPFQLGAFKAAIDTGRPICPVVASGARDILPDETLLPRPGRVRVTFGPLIWPTGSGWQELIRLREATRDAFAKNSGEGLL